MTPRPLSRTLLPLFALAALIGTATHASAQVDPLLALKRLPPNVIIVMDTSFPMLSDGNGNFYDPKTYTRPFTVKHYWQRRPDLDVLEYFCADNRRPDAEGHTGSKP